MTTAISPETGEQFEIRIGRDRYDHAGQEGARMQVLNEDDFVELLQNRLRKTAAEIHKILDSYRQSAGKI